MREFLGGASVVVFIKVNVEVLNCSGASHPSNDKDYNDAQDAKGELVVLHGDGLYPLIPPEL